MGTALSCAHDLEVKHREGGHVMKNTRNDRWSRLGGRRGIVLFVAGALALGLGATAVQAFGDRSSSTRTQPEPSATVTSPSPRAPGTLTPSVSVATPPPIQDPNALADGVYPTYVRAVDIQGATVTVDVLQTFFGDAAHQAAIEDGVPWKDVQFDPVYIRNENPLLRTLPVSRDVDIKLIGMCDAPSRRIGLTELQQATTPFTNLFYYEVTMVDGTVTGVLQKVAVSAC
jgi:hypothetical protein